MVRSPSIEKKGLKKGAWSEEEDNKLRAYVLRYGHWNWQLLPKFAGLSRCGKSCRLRWLNYLKPGLKRGSYSKEEEEMIIKLHEEHGSKWSIIAAKLSGRTDNEIKNYWHTRVKKFKKQDPNSAEKTKGTSHNMHVTDKKDQISSISPSKSTDQETDQSAAEESFPKFFDNIWSEPFSPITSYSSVSSGIRLQDLVIENGGISLDDSFGKSFESFSTEPVFSNASNGLISPSTSSNISSVTNSEETSAEEFWSFWTEPFSLDTFYNPMDERLPLTSYSDFNDDLFYQF